MKSSEIRQGFIDYFKRHDHQVVESSSLIPFDDPTLLFTNAGMNQFKRVFLGEETLPYKRATSSQKCMRAGGKHNDLENVGETARHNTFFEMLGNFSFGDYFKEEAIFYCWEFVTKDLGINPEKLWASVYLEDDEAFRLWGKIAPELKGRILRFDEKENYWSMGETGPCGPCSELHVDRGEKFDFGGPPSRVNGPGDRFVELWNLVFMQFNKDENGQTSPLPKPSVDTGAGLERFTCFLQGAATNYETDLFQPIIREIEELSGKKYSTDKTGLSHRVIADHIRALTFAFADGAVPSNEKRGYVLRRILRRAARHGRLLDLKEPFIYKLAKTVASNMGTAYPALKTKLEHVTSMIKAEEERFGETLDLGLELFDRVADKVTSAGGDIIPGEEAFKLYDTFGFPLDLTQVMARERGLTVDEKRFEEELAKQQEKSKEDYNAKKFAFGGRGFSMMVGEDTKFVGYDDNFISQATLLNVQEAEEKGILVAYLDQTPFYAESGGQIADIGYIKADGFTFEVISTQKYGQIVLHIGKVIEGKWQDFQNKLVSAQVNGILQKATQRNHTATHLLHRALREVLGEHVHQAGSLVAPDRLRFDFAHFKAVEPLELELIEEKVNRAILENRPVKWNITDFETAKKKGAMALFGEKYGDAVRLVEVQDFSRELCGGTHVQATGEIGLFVITSESAIAAGMRRIEALTGEAALKHLRAKKEEAETAGQILKVPTDKLVERVIALAESEKKLSRELMEIRKHEEAKNVKDKVSQGEMVGRVKLILDTVSGRDAALTYIDQIKKSEQPTFVGLLNQQNYFLAASASAIEIGFSAQEMIASINQKFSGRGGGKPYFAQGGTSAAISMEEFGNAIREFLIKKSGGSE